MVRTGGGFVQRTDDLPLNERGAVGMVDPCKDALT